MRRWVIVICSLTLALACNFPGFPGMNPLLRPTETVTPEALPGETEDATDPQDDDQNTKSTPLPLETPEPADIDGTETPTMTPTPTATATSTATLTPTVTLTPTATATPTPEPIVPGPPLAFEEHAWDLVEWHEIPETGDWEGTIRIHVIGGTAPYRSQLENQEIVDGLEVQARWRLCKAMPATIRVWSADEQYVHTGIWVWELGCNGS